MDHKFSSSGLQFSPCVPRTSSRLGTWVDPDPHSGKPQRGCPWGQDRVYVSIGLRLSPEKTSQGGPRLSGTLSSRHRPALGPLFPQRWETRLPPGAPRRGADQLRTLRVPTPATALGLSPLLPLLVTSSAATASLCSQKPCRFSRDVASEYGRSGVRLGRQSFGSGGQAASKVSESRRPTEDSPKP